MKKSEEKTNTGWPVPVKIKEDFTKFCADKGLVAQEDCAGALFIWQYIPAEIRERAKDQAKGLGKVTKKFWKNNFHNAAKNCVITDAVSNNDLDKIEQQAIQDIRLACQKARNIVSRSLAQSEGQKQNIDQNDVSEAG